MLFSITAFTSKAQMKIPGTAIGQTPGTSRIYMGSPSICILSNGNLIASNDFFGSNPEARVNGKSITRIYQSKDAGASWVVVTDIVGQFMSTLFVQGGKLYIIGLSGNEGNVIIRKSTDNGASWTVPSDSTNGVLKKGKFHTAPTPVVLHNGRIWRAMEDADGTVKTWPKKYSAFMLSASANANLLEANNWLSSNALPYDASYLGGYFYGWLEGNAVVGPKGDMLNVMRVHTFDKTRERIALIHVDETGAKSSFDAKDGFKDFPGGGKKFTIRYDSLSSKYYTLSNYVPTAYRGTIPLDRVRNTLALCSSKDLADWNVDSIIIHHPDTLKHGFQYVDWQFDGNDIIAVSRTAFEDANSYHNTNFLTFHRIKNFRGQPLPEPLKYDDNAINPFGLGIDLIPAVLPSKNLLASTSLLGNGIYYSKFIGKRKNGELLYNKPTYQDDLSRKIGIVKIIYALDGNPQLFATNKANKQWNLWRLKETADDLDLTDPIPILVGGKRLTDDFTLITVKNSAFILRASEPNKIKYWPGGKNPWVYPPNPEIGFNKGYNASNQWAGDKTEIFFEYAEQEKGSECTFGPWKPVLRNGTPFKMMVYASQAKLHALDLLKAGKKQILFATDVDQLSLWDVNISEGKLTMDSLPLPQGIDHTIKNSYFSTPVTATEEGFILGGNPGVLTEYYKDKNLWKTRPVLMRGGDLHVETLVAPHWVDWDGDGASDIIAGDGTGYLWLIKNYGTDAKPLWKSSLKLKANGQVIQHQAGLTGSIQGPNEKRWGYLQPTVCDWDGDGLLDVVCNDITGNHIVYKNIGKPENPILAAKKPLFFLNQPYKAAWRSKPAVLPLKYMSDKNKNTLSSYLAINGKGELCLYQRDISSPNTLKNEQVMLNTDSEPVRIVGYAGHEGRATLAICDYNQDGIWDVLFGQGIHMSQSKIAPGAVPYATAYIMLNKGTNKRPLFDTPKPIYQANGLKINMDVHGCWVSPILDKNDKLVDLLAGGEDGRFYLFKNIIYDTTK